MIEHMGVFFFFLNKQSTKPEAEQYFCKYKIYDHYLAFQKHLGFEFLFSLLWKAISFLWHSLPVDLIVTKSLQRAPDLSTELTFKTLPKSSHDPYCPESFFLGSEMGMIVNYNCALLTKHFVSLTFCVPV